MENKNSKYELVAINGIDEYIQFVKDSCINTIKPLYIEKIVIYYADGSVTEIAGCEIKAPVPITHDLSLPRGSYNTECIDNVKVHLDVQRVALEVELIVSHLLP